MSENKQGVGEFGGFRIVADPSAPIGEIHARMGKDAYLRHLRSVAQDFQKARAAKLAQLGARAVEILKRDVRGSGKQMAALFDIAAAARALGLLGESEVKP